MVDFLGFVLVLYTGWCQEYLIKCSKGPQSRFINFCWSSVMRHSKSVTFAWRAFTIFNFRQDQVSRSSARPAVEPKLLTSCILLRWGGKHCPQVGELQSFVLVLGRKMGSLSKVTWGCQGGKATSTRPCSIATRYPWALKLYLSLLSSSLQQRRMLRQSLALETASRCPLPTTTTRSASPPNISVTSFIVQR